MNDLKYKILQTVHSLGPIDPPTKVEFYNSTGADSIDIQSSIEDLLAQELLYERVQHLYITPAGISAMEAEQSKREQIAQAEKTAKLDRRPQWVAVGLSLCALIISIIALWRAW